MNNIKYIFCQIENTCQNLVMKTFRRSFCHFPALIKRHFQDYFTHIDTSQSVGGAKREYPGKTT